MAILPVTIQDSSPHVLDKSALYYGDSPRDVQMRAVPPAAAQPASAHPPNTCELPQVGGGLKHIDSRSTYPLAERSASACAIAAAASSVRPISCSIWARVS